MSLSKTSLNNSLRLTAATLTTALALSLIATALQAQSFFVSEPDGARGYYMDDNGDTKSETIQIRPAAPKELLGGDQVNDFDLDSVSRSRSLRCFCTDLINSSICF